MPKTKKGHGRNAKPIGERLMSRVHKSDTCWLWTGPTRNGYGRISVKGSLRSVHRVSYEIFVGSIPDELDVLHQCDVRNCIKPDHLFLGNDFVNMQDMIQKGRWSLHYGESNGMAKTPIRTIRLIREFGKIVTNKSKLARILGISRGRVSSVLLGYSWKHSS